MHIPTFCNGVFFYQIYVVFNANLNIFESIFLGFSRYLNSFHSVITIHFLYVYQILSRNVEICWFYNDVYIFYVSVNKSTNNKLGPTPIHSCLHLSESTVLSSWHFKRGDFTIFFYSSKKKTLR